MHWRPGAGVVGARVAAEYREGLSAGRRHCFGSSTQTEVVARLTTTPVHSTEPMSACVSRYPSGPVKEKSKTVQAVERPGKRIERRPIRLSTVRTAPGSERTGGSVESTRETSVPRVDRGRTQTQACRETRPEIRVEAWTIRGAARIKGASERK